MIFKDSKKVMWYQRFSSTSRKLLISKKHFCAKKIAFAKEVSVKSNVIYRTHFFPLAVLFPIKKIYKLFPIAFRKIHCMVVTKESQFGKI